MGLESESLTSISQIHVYALLLAQWDDDCFAPLDNFLPFLVYTLSDMEISSYSPTEYRTLLCSEVQKAWKKKLNFFVPLSSIRELLLRAQHKGYIFKEIDRYFIDTKKLANQKKIYDRNHNDIARSFGTLYTRFSRYLETYRLQVERTSEENGLLQPGQVEELLISCLSRFSSDILEMHWKLKDKALKFVRGADNEGEVAFINFILHTNAADPEGWEFLISLVKGALLCNSMYILDAIHEKADLSEVEFYIDTPILFRSLGYTYDFRAAKANEMFSCLRMVNATLCCYEHTIKEMKRVLKRSHDAVVAAQKQEDVKSRFEITAYFLREHTRPSEILLILQNLEADIQARGIKIKQCIEAPQDSKAVPLQLQNKLSDDGVYREHASQTLRTDVDSMCSVFYKRGCKLGDDIAEAKTVFVTSNDPLRVSANKYFRNYPSKKVDYGDFDICLSDDTVATIAWLLEPDRPKAYPVKRLISECYATLLPSDETWGQILQYVKTLMDKGEVTPQDYYQVRASLEIKKQYGMEISGAKEIDYESIHGFVYSVKDKVRMEDAVYMSSRIINKQQMKIDERADILAVKLTTIMAIVILVLLICSGLFCSPLLGITSMQGKFASAIAIIVLTGIGLQAYAFSTGRNLLDIRRGMKRYVRKGVKMFIGGLVPSSELSIDELGEILDSSRNRRGERREKNVKEDEEDTNGE
jgi:hypothetical protein